MLTESRSRERLALYHSDMSSSSCNLPPNLVDSISLGRKSGVSTEARSVMEFSFMGPVWPSTNCPHSKATRTSRRLYEFPAGHDSRRPLFRGNLKRSRTAIIKEALRGHLRHHSSQVWWVKVLVCAYAALRTLSLFHPPSCIEAGLQNSVSAACESTQTKLSETKSSMTATALARSQPRLSSSIETVTYPRTWITSRTVD